MRAFGREVTAGSGSAAPAPPGTLAHGDNLPLAALSLSAAGALIGRRVQLSRGECLCEAGSALTHLYFPLCGLVSLAHTARNGGSTHLALVGREGVIGVEAFLGAEKAGYRAVVQLPGAAYRLPLGALRPLLGRDDPSPLLKYALALMLEISRASVCNLRHSVEQRLCRALLQSADRAGADVLPMTHDELASLVGARRQGVSEVAHQLRELGLIASGRGSIALVGRAGLVARACECYEAPKRQRESRRPPEGLRGALPSGHEARPLAD